MRVKTASVFCIIIQGVQHLIVRGTKSAFENWYYLNIITIPIGFAVE